jgi:uncharacterized protein
MKESEAISLLRKYSPDDSTFMIILAHAEKVKDTALKLSKNAKRIDKKFIATASILHDIGRYAYPPGKDAAKHGVAGAEILQKEGLPLHARVAERHLGAGMTKEDIIKQKLDIHAKDYVPKTKEEKIICYADKLVSGTDVMTYSQAKKDLEKRYGKEYGKRFFLLKKEVMGILKRKQQ